MYYDIKKVGLPQSLREKADDIYTNNKAKINALSKLFFPFPDILKGQSDMVRLAVVLKSFERTHDFYKSKIISDDVFYDTIKDVAVWCENNQNNGLKNYRWLHNHASGKLFKIGRLQFQMYKAPMGPDYTKLPFKRGDNLLYIHIPQGEKLTRESCTDSVRRGNSTTTSVLYLPPLCRLFSQITFKLAASCWVAIWIRSENCSHSALPNFF